MEKKKGQQAVVGLLFAFILIAIFSILLLPLLEFIELGVNATVNATNGVLLALTINTIPVILGLVILIAVVILITGR